MPDVAIVGAGPVGGILALAIADADLSVVAFDARERGATLRTDRSLAISHGARLIFERLGVFARLTAIPGAVTPIDTVDISQAGGFGVTKLRAAEHGVPALGYVVSYRALQGAVDAALAQTGAEVRFASPVARVDAMPGQANVVLDSGESVAAKLAVVADGTGTAVPGVSRVKREYGQVAVVAKVTTSAPHGGAAYERFTSTGPIALLPEHGEYGLVWTLPPPAAQRVLALPETEFLAELRRHFGARRSDFTGVRDRRSFPLALEYATPTTASHCVLIGNAAQSLHPIAGQGFNLGLRDAFELAREINAASAEELGARAMLARYAARRSIDRRAGIAFTHGLARLFALDSAIFRWPRGVGLALLDALPPAKRAFTRAMLYGLS
jgi:2-octaprenyl-6-methoxyphenol hydroxylase